MIARIARDAADAGAPAYPPLQQRARDVSGSLAYSLLFRLYSQGGVHPYRMSILPLIDDAPERNAVLVRGAPVQEPTDDPYYLAALLTIIIHERLATQEPGLNLPSVEPLKDRVSQLKSDIDAEG